MANGEGVADMSGEGVKVNVNRKWRDQRASLSGQGMKRDGGGCEWSLDDYFLAEVMVFGSWWESASTITSRWYGSRQAPSLLMLAVAKVSTASSERSATGHSHLHHSHLRSCCLCQRPSPSCRAKARYVRPTPSSVCTTSISGAVRTHVLAIKCLPSAQHSPLTAARSLNE